LEIRHSLGTTPDFDSLDCCCIWVNSQMFKVVVERKVAQCSA
jgi:hypothetical protein